MSSPKSASVRYYVDADILGLAKTLARLRPDVTYPGDPGGMVHKRQRPACPISDPSTPDTVWVPEIARRGWLILTRDHNIRNLPAERSAVKDSRARMVALAGDDASSTWGQLEVVMSRWRQIERVATEEDGPFIIRASRTVWRRLDLDEADVAVRSGRRRVRRLDSGQPELWEGR